MRIRWLTGPLLLTCAGLWACVGGAATHTDNPPNGAGDAPPRADAAVEAPAESFENAAAPFFATYCFACHRGQRQEGDIDLSILTATNFAEHAELWEEIGFQVESGGMPAGWGNKPTADEREAFVAWVNARLEATQAAD
ncbi:hypothetical protein OT109_12745 [Phycisphaeraceae bacterium D3-23]